MIPEKIRLKQIGPYKDETIDFSDMGDIISITGNNGEGKTILVESCFCALYRFFPFRKASIFKFCQGKDAQIEFWFKDGSDNYRSLININSVKNSMESFLFKNKICLNDDGLNGTFDKEVAKRFGSARMILASSFGAQNKKGSFAEIEKAERKSLFMSMIGQEDLQKISDLCSKKETKCKEDYDKELLSYKKISETADMELPDVQGTQESVFAAQIDVSSVGELVDVCREELGCAKGKFSNLDQIQSRMSGLLSRKKNTESFIFSTRKEISSLISSRDLLPALKGKASGVERLKEAVDIKKLERSNLTNSLSQYLKEAKEYSEEKSSIEKEVSNIEKELSSLEKNLSYAKRDSVIIGSVPCKAEGKCSECQFLVNAVLARDNMGNLTGDISGKKAMKLSCNVRLDNIKPPRNSNVQDINSKIETLNRFISSTEEEISSMMVAAVKASAIEESVKSIISKEMDLEKLEVDLREISSEISALTPDLDEAIKGHSLIDEAEKELKNRMNELESSKKILDLRINQFKKFEAELELILLARRQAEEKKSILSSIDRDRKSWKLLSQAFGKTGIQSIQINGSSPIISQFGNDLLFSCFGPRFSIKFITQAEKQSGGLKDDFDIYVYDSKNNREGSIDDLSGGERAIVNEAVCLSIALFNRGRSNTGWSSLIRDETSGSMDVEKAPMYINMLRKAKSLGHFSKLLFISHLDIVKDMGDTKLIVENGKVRVE